MVMLRHVLGAELRRRRVEQRRTLLDVSTTAMVSLGYLSEVERGRKEVSSECLSAICAALGASLASVLSAVATEVALREHAATVVALPKRTSDSAAA